MLATGPVETLGHPFRIVTEVPLIRDIGRHTTFSFGTKFLYTDLKVDLPEPVDAVVVWDPGWLRTGTGEGAIHEIHKIWEMAQEWDAPVVGLFSDWFAAWEVADGIVGTKTATMYMDAIIIDSAGAAALRRSVHPLTVTDENDRRYCPIVVNDSFLSYGRLPRIGGDLDLDVAKIHEREIDVSMVSTLHPQHVVLRPYYVDLMERICADNGWSFVWTDKATAEEMEDLYLRSKVVFNVSLGSQPNCRVYEALACGCLLLTDGWNIGMKGVPCVRYTDPWKLEIALFDLLSSEPARQARMQYRGLTWAQAHSPTRTFERVFDQALEAASQTRSARVARRVFREEREALHAAN